MVDKRLLIISPNFPPVNAADMHRVRMSLPYYKQSGWNASVVFVDEKYVEGSLDNLLIETIPSYVDKHRVKAFPTWLTRKFGLGSLSIRSLIFYYFEVNKLLKKDKFDLIFFSTTMFHVGVLGPYWKWRFNVPFVVDLQDPWRNDYYLGKPKSQRPKKFWFSYVLLKWTEKFAIPKCAGIISVSNGYISEIIKRYPWRANIPFVLIPFGSSTIDFDMLNKKSVDSFPFNERSSLKKNIVYIGAITAEFIPIIQVFFESLIVNGFDFSQCHFYFLGTSYNLNESRTLVADLAESLAIGSSVTERTERIPYFQTLATLKSADILFIPGSLDVNYNASKVYNSILSGTPIYSIFNNRSEVKRIIEKSKSGIVVGFDTLDDLRGELNKNVLDIMKLEKHSRDSIIPDEILAVYRTKQQCDFFNLCISV
jgi:hypothetical protein